MICKIYRLKELTKMVGLSKATIYRKMKAGTFPASVALSDRATGWRAEEIEQWLANL